MTQKEIEIRLINLEKAFVQSQKNIVPTVDKVVQNTSDIADNREGIAETFEASMTNTDDISILRDGLMEVYEMLAESEVE